MDSKIVSAGIRSEVRPYVKKAGFSKFTGRNSWRFHDDRIEVINFQSFNSYNAGVIGCTTISFSVNLGIYFRYIPDQYARCSNEANEPGFKPHEYACHFRGTLHRSFAQPELDRRDIWYIDSNGDYLEKSLHDVRMALGRDAMPWFDRFSDNREVLRTLLEDDEEMQVLWGFGRNPSPVRHYMTGYVARNVDDAKLASFHLAKAIESGCFNSVRSQLAKDAASCCQ
jgi:hypothetical protein